VEKNIVESDRPQITTWRLRIACRVPGATSNKECTKASQCYAIRTLPVLFNSVQGEEIVFRPGIQ